MRKKCFILAIMITFLTGCINRNSHEVIAWDHAIRMNIPAQSTECTSYLSPWSNMVPRFAGDFPEADSNNQQYQIERITVEGRVCYLIDTNEYYELPDMGIDSALDGGDETKRFQSWSIDCAFLEYAGTSENYSVYLPQDGDGEVLVLRNQNESLLLARKDSILLDAGNYDSRLFSSYCFDGKYYAAASNYPQILDAIRSISADKADVPENAWLIPMTLKMESNMYPGLCFSVHYYQWGKDQYVFNAVTNGLVKVDDSISFEEDDRILVAETSAYELGEEFARWSIRQPECNGRYVQNWKVSDKFIPVKKDDADTYEIEGTLYQTIPLGEMDRMGWKVNLAFFKEIGRVEEEEQTVLLTNIERNDMRILYANDSLVLLIETNCDLAIKRTPQISRFGVCWINNGIILPASDAAVLLTVLMDKESDTDIPIRFESTEYPGLYYCGWITEETYNRLETRVTRGTSS